MEYADLIKATELIRSAQGQPAVEKFNCHQITADFLKENFCAKNFELWSGYGNSFFGTPIHVEEYLYPGFMEAILSDGTRQIIDLRRKSAEEKLLP